MEFLNEKIKNIHGHGENNLESIKICKLLVENTVECIWLYDLGNMHFKYVSPAIVELRGLTVEEAMEERLGDSLTPESFEKMSIIIQERVERFLNGHKGREVISGIDEFQQHCKDGTIKTKISTKLMLNENTNYVDILGVSRDITERKKVELRLKDKICEKDKLIRNMKKSEKKFSILIGKLIQKNNHLNNIAVTDKLTGVYNRYFFEKNVIKKIEETTNNDISLTLIILDLDGFKDVNDIYGHDEGDKILRKVADAGVKLMGKDNILARWGGDEFVVLAIKTDLDAARRLAEKLRQSIETVLQKESGQVTASLGIAERRDSEAFECWFRRVDKALYKAKNSGGNCVAID